jgi:hypothetical protein
MAGTSPAMTIFVTPRTGALRPAPRKRGEGKITQPDVDANLGALPYGFSVSRNRTGSPCDGVTSSPCHITRLPRTNVPTGQPVTRKPS